MSDAPWQWWRRRAPADSTRARGGRFAAWSRPPLWQASTLLPAPVALLHGQDPHERLHRVNLAVVNLEGFPHGQLIAAAFADAPSHAQQHDAHALVHGDDPCLRVTEPPEDRQRLGGDVLAARSELAVR